MKQRERIPKDPQVLPLVLPFFAIFCPYSAIFAHIPPYMPIFAKVKGKPLILKIPPSFGLVTFSVILGILRSSKSSFILDLCAYSHKGVVTSLCWDLVFWLRIRLYSSSPTYITPAPLFDLSFSKILHDYPNT